MKVQLKTIVTLHCRLLLFAPFITVFCEKRKRQKSSFPCKQKKKEEMKAIKRLREKQVIMGDFYESPLCIKA